MMDFKAYVAGRLVYLSGPISDVDGAGELFARGERTLRRMGAASVCNPMAPRTQERRKGWTHEMHMLADIHALTTSHKGDGTPSYVLVSLPGWTASAGAKTERAVAEACGLECYDLPAALMTD